MSSGPPRHDDQIQAALVSLANLLKVHGGETYDPLLRNVLDFKKDFPSSDGTLPGAPAQYGTWQPPLVTERPRKPYILSIAIEVVERILDFAAFPDLVALGKTNKLLQEFVRNYLNRSLNAFLQRWFLDAMAFRFAMTDTWAVISGSAALSFISRDTTWESKDLDLYVPKGYFCTLLLRHLVDKEGYIQLPHVEDQDQDAYPPRNHIHHVHKLVRVKEVEDPMTGETEACVDTSIDVIESEDGNPIEPIICFHTTYVMNYISSYHIIVFYPKLTFAKEGVEHHLIVDARTRLWRDKYADRGFKTHRLAKDFGRACGAACPALLRTSKDAGCMDVALSGNGFQDRAREVSWLTGYGGASDLGALSRAICSNPHCPRSKGQSSNILGLRRVQG